MPEPPRPAGTAEQLGRRTALREELHRAFTSPYEAPVVVLVNGLLVTGCWFLLPSDSVFRVHAAWFFPLALASWMISDVPATNVLGSDYAQMSRVLDRTPELRRRLAAKTLVLWLLVVPICMLVALGIAFSGSDGSGLTVPATVAALITVPFGTLAISGWLGTRWPYHALPLRERWVHRRPYRRMVVRWLVLVFIPYLIVPVIAALLLLPVVAGWRLTSDSGSWWPSSDRAFAVGALCLALIAALAWLGGRAMTVRSVARHSTELRSFLDDPHMG
ncbi:MAG: hypothetical protein ACJ735_00345 [Actinomycetes bacterium]